MQRGLGLTHEAFLLFALWSVPQLCITTGQKGLTGWISHGQWDSFDVIFDELDGCSHLFSPVCKLSVSPCGFRSKFLNSAFLYSQATSNQHCPPRQDGKTHFCPNDFNKHLNGVLRSFTSVAVSISVLCLQTSSPCLTFFLYFYLQHHWLINNTKKNLLEAEKKETKPVPPKCS